MRTILNFIDGRHVEPAGGRFFDKINPATGEVIARVPDSDEHDIELAVAAALNAFPLVRLARGRALPADDGRRRQDRGESRSFG